MDNSTNLSGKFVLRLNPELHKSLRQEAHQKGESLNTLCVQKLGQRKDFCGLLEASFLDELISQWRPLGVAVFGSFARNESRKSSDIDLLVVLKDSDYISREQYRRWDKIFKEETKYSPQFVHKPRLNEAIGSIWLEASIEGEILYDSSGELKRTFLGIRREIALGVYTRKESHGHSYWVRRELNAK